MIQQEVLVADHRACVSGMSSWLESIQELVHILETEDSMTEELNYAERILDLLDQQYSQQKSWRHYIKCPRWSQKVEPWDKLLLPAVDQLIKKTDTFNNPNSPVDIHSLNHDEKKRVFKDSLYVVKVYHMGHTKVVKKIKVGESSQNKASIDGLDKDLSEDIKTLETNYVASVSRMCSWLERMGKIIRNRK
jgi:uncharacterized protein YihD (DUF1040 family)